LERVLETFEELGVFKSCQAFYVNQLKGSLFYFIILQKFFENNFRITDFEDLNFSEEVTVYLAAFLREESELETFADVLLNKYDVSQQFTLEQLKQLVLVITQIQKKRVSSLKLSG